MIFISTCVKVSVRLCIILFYCLNLRAENLVLSKVRSDSSGIGIYKGGNHRLRNLSQDSLYYIHSESFPLNFGRKIGSSIASQKHILEKERYIRRKAPKGFQTIEEKKEPEFYSRTDEIKKKLKEKLPNANIVDIWSHFSYTGSIRKGCLSGRQLPSKNVKRPNYYKTGIPTYVKYPESDRGENDERGTLKTERDIEGIRKACRIAREILDFASLIVVEGMFTDDVDRYIHKLCAVKNVYPATLNYKGFPKSVCTSVNEVACHGIPDSNLLTAGDLLKIDLSIYCEGYYGDVCETYMVMPMSEKYKRGLFKTKFMGRSERNKMIYRSIKHSNLLGFESKIVYETSVLKNINASLKEFDFSSNLFEMMKLLFSFSTTQKFKFEQDEIMFQLAKKMVEQSKSLYENPGKKYEGRIVGMPASVYPGYIPDGKLRRVFTTVEDPQLVVDKLNVKDEKRYNKPYLFSHTFEHDLELMKITHEALTRAISVCKPGTKMSVIGKTIEKYLETENCRTLSNLCGHGIGRNFHETPHVYHEINDSKVVMEPGMVFTIEPIVTRSKLNSVIMWPDGWTLTTLDGSKTAQFEHTILITKNGHEVLTRRLPSSPPFFWEVPLQIIY